jgi:peptidoglycan hydrolase-like protein with peptidoglycan-binding domain
VSARTAVAVAATLLAAAGTIVAALLVRGDGDAEAASTTESATGRAAVERRDLVVRESFDGTLGYEDVRPLAAGGSGIVTRLPAEGAVVRRGDVLYEVDGRGVRLLYGAVPLYRGLASGVSDGADVRQLEENLVALRHDPDRDITVDAHFDWATRAAVRRWEHERGAREDGAVDRGEAVFLPGARRVGSVRANVGGVLQPGAEVLETTSTRPVVTLQLDARRRQLVSRGDPVQVELPSGRLAAGSVLSVGTVAESEPAQDGQGAADPTVEVEVRVTGSTGLDGAPVDVRLATERERGVLAVPVEALLALRGGGYALELVRGGVRTLVAVRAGTFADGWVEVSGDGLHEGQTVVTPG